MKKAIYTGGVLAAVALAVLVHQTTVDAQDRNRVAIQGLDIPLVGPGSSIGLTVRDTDTGVVVQQVRADSPASRAGVKEGDIVTEFDGERARSAAQLTRLVRETPPRRTVKIVVWREGTSQTMDIAPETRDPDDLRFPNLTRDIERHLQAFPREFNFDFDFEAAGFTSFSQRRLGVTVTPLSDQLAAYFGVKQGALVSEVAAGAAGETAGIKAGDVILSVKGQMVAGPSDVVRELRQAESGADVEIRVMRDRKEIALTARIPERVRASSRRGGRTI